MRLLFDHRSSSWPKQALETTECQGWFGLRGSPCEASALIYEQLGLATSGVRRAIWCRSPRPLHRAEPALCRSWPAPDARIFATRRGGRAWQRPSGLRLEGRRIRPTLGRSQNGEESALDNNPSMISLDGRVAAQPSSPSAMSTARQRALRKARSPKLMSTWSQRALRRLPAPQSNKSKKAPFSQGLFVSCAGRI
jgi:hypothetical protein